MSAPRTPPAPAASGWRVTSQIESTDRDITGAFVPGHRVYFTTAGGQLGSVFISAANYTADSVRAAIMAKAALLDAVSNLSG